MVYLSEENKDFLNMAEEKNTRALANGSWSKTGLEHYESHSHGSWSGELFCFDAYSNNTVIVNGDCTSYSGNLDEMKAQIILKTSSGSVVLTRDYSWDLGRNWTGTCPFDFRLTPDEILKFGPYGSTIKVYIKIFVNRGSSGCGGRARVYLNCYGEDGHLLKDLSGGSNKKDVYAQKFFGYESHNGCNNYSHHIDSQGVIKGSVCFSHVCNSEGSHKGNTQGSGYVRIHVRVVKSSTGEVLVDRLVYDSGSMHGDRRINKNKEVALNINYGFPVNVYAKVNCYGGVFKAHIWGGRSWISVIRYVDLSILAETVSTYSDEKIKTFEIAERSQYYSPFNTYKKTHILENSLGKVFDVSLKANLDYIFYKKYLTKELYKCTNINGSLNNIVFTESDVVNIEKFLGEIKTPDSDACSFDLDASKLNTLPKVIFKKILEYKNKNIKIATEAKISKSDNKNIELTTILEVVNEKKSETITNVNEESFVKFIGEYKIVEKNGGDGNIEEFTE